MAFPNETVNTQDSEFPTAVITLRPAQTETNDPLSEDPDLAEGRDINKVLANQRALARAAGISAKGLIKINDPGGTPTADIGDMKLTVDTALVSLPATLGLALTPAVMNYIFVEFNGGPPAVVVSVSPFPLTEKILPLGTWDGSGPDDEAVDLRPAMQMKQAIMLGIDAPPASGFAGENVTARPGKGDGAGAHGGFLVEHKEFGGGMIVAPVNVVLSGSGATLTAVGAIPAGATVIGATSFVTVGDGGGGGAGGMDVGMTGDTTAFAAGTGIGASSATAMASGATLPGPAHFGAAGDVILTAGGGTFDTITVRVVLWLRVWAAPTS